MIGNDYVRAARAKGLPERDRRRPLRPPRPRCRRSSRCSASSSRTCSPARSSSRRSSPGRASGSTPTRPRSTSTCRRSPGVSLFVAFVYVTVNFVVDVLYGRHRPEDPGHVTRASRFGCACRRGRRRLTADPGGSRSRSIGSSIALAWIVDRRLRAADRARRSARADVHARRSRPSLHHLFGTDELGRDVLSRVIYGSRVSIPIALVLVALAATIGGVDRRVAGYFRGVTDGVLMRAADLVFAFPPIILAMVVAAVLGRGLQNAALAIVVVAWPSYARVVRGLVLSVGDSEYVQSARLLGAPRAAHAVPRRAPERRRAGARARDARPRERDPAARRASRSSASAPSRRRRSGDRWSPTARSTSSGGGWGRSPGSRSSPSCSRSTSSATACATSFDPRTAWRSSEETP